VCSKKPCKVTYYFLKEAKEIKEIRNLPELKPQNNAV
jgi:hypothetical protein